MSKTTCIVMALVAAAGCKKKSSTDGPMIDAGVKATTALPAAKGDAGSAPVAVAAGADRADAGEPFEAPSQAECEQAITHVFTIMVADATKDAKPADSAKLKLAMKEQFASMKDEAIKNCLKTPRKLVQCSIAAKSMDEFQACQPGVDKKPHGGKPDWTKYGGPKATAADCKGLGAMVSKIFEKDPQLAKLPPEQRTQLKASLSRVDEDCVGMPMVALECFKKAKSLQDLSGCGQVVAPGAGGPDDHDGHDHP